MSNNKQSSIDFFWNQLPEILPFSVDTETAVKLWGAFEQAKEMHKEEHRETWDECLLSSNPEKTFEDHYNETFGDESNN